MVIKTHLLEFPFNDNIYITHVGHKQLSIVCRVGGGGGELARASLAGMLQVVMTPFTVLVPFADWTNRIVTLAIFNENLPKGIIVRSGLWRDKWNVFKIKEAGDCQINYSLSGILSFFEKLQKLSFLPTREKNNKSTHTTMFQSGSVFHRLTKSDIYLQAMPSLYSKWEWINFNFKLGFVSTVGDKLRLEKKVYFCNSSVRLKHSNNVFDTYTT